MCTFGACLFPIILFDPNAIFGSADPSGKFSGFWKSGEPAATMCFFSVLFFGGLWLVELVAKIVLQGRCATRAGRYIIAGELVLTCAIVAIAFLIGFTIKDMVAGAAASSNSTTTDATTTEAAVPAPE